MTKTIKIRSWHALIPCLVLAVGACGGEPSSEPPAQVQTEQASPAESQTEAEGSIDNPYAATLAELEGLSGEERRTRLVELAQEEGATVDAYGSNTDLPDLAEAFSAEYDIPVEVYRALANEVTQRVLQEADAGRLQADLIDNNGVEMAILANEGMTVDYTGPVEADLREGTNWDGWTANRFTLIAPAWNTDTVTEPPAEFAELADPRFSGQLIMEPRGYDWYLTLSTWFQDNGMTQEEFDEMFLGVVRNATLLNSHNNHVGFLSSGEFGISAGTYHHLIDDGIAAGAPLARLPAIAPVIARPNGHALSRTTDAPASTLLFFEWLLTDAQPALVEEYRIPALQTGEAEHLLEGIEELVTIDIDRVAEEGPEWEDRFEELIREAAGTAEAPPG